MTALTETAVPPVQPAVPRGTPHVLFPAAELAAGERRIVEVDGKSIGVLNVEGRLHALLNLCPHHGAPLCEGAVKGTMKDTAPHEYDFDPTVKWIACPWHGYEYNLETGRPLVANERTRVRVFQVRVQDGNVVLYV